MPTNDHSPAAEEITGSQIAFKGKLLTIEVRDVRLRSGHQTVREIVQHPGAVAMVVTDSLGKLLLIRQWRTATGRSILEIPAGTREPDESAEACAIREVEEETGYHPNRIDRLGGFYLAPGYSTEYIDLYLASDLQASSSQPEEDEIIEAVPVTLDEALLLIESGEIEDAKTISGILLYKHLSGR